MVRRRQGNPIRLLHLRKDRHICFKVLCQLNLFMNVQSLKDDQCFWGLCKNVHLKCILLNISNNIHPTHENKWNVASCAVNELPSCFAQSLMTKGQTEPWLDPSLPSWCWYCWWCCLGYWTTKSNPIIPGTLTDIWAVLIRFVLKKSDREFLFASRCCTCPETAGNCQNDSANKDDVEAQVEGKTLIWLT